MAVLTPERSAPSSGAPQRESRRLGFSQRLGRWDVKLSPYLYISPFFILFAVIGLFPLGYTAFVSVHEWSLLGGQGEFVGLQNFADVLAQPTFWKSLVNTFASSCSPRCRRWSSRSRSRPCWTEPASGDVLAHGRADPLRGGARRGVDDLRPPVRRSVGLINAMLAAVGLDPIAWHGDRIASHVAIATMVNYRWMGYNALIFLAAMQAVPRDLYEAAVIDGAGRVRQFFSITVPQIRATIIFVVITSTIGGLQIFDEVRLFDTSGSAVRTRTG